MRAVQPDDTRGNRIGLRLTCGNNTTDCTWAMLGRAMNAVPCRRTTTWPSADSEGNHRAGRQRMLTPDDANGVLNHAVKDTVTTQSTF